MQCRRQRRRMISDDPLTCVASPQVKTPLASKARIDRRRPIPNMGTVIRRLEAFKLGCVNLWISMPEDMAHNNSTIIPSVVALDLTQPDPKTLTGRPVQPFAEGLRVGLGRFRILGIENRFFFAHGMVKKIWFFYIDRVDSQSIPIPTFLGIAQR